MPRIPDHELRGMFNPEGEEYDPSFDEVRGDRRVVEGVSRRLLDLQMQLREIVDQLRYSARLPGSGMTNYNGEGVSSPENIVDEYGLILKQIEDIRDPAARKELLEKAKPVTELLVQQHVPYLIRLVDWYGYSNSPVEAKLGGCNISDEEIRAHLMEARENIGSANIPEEDKTLLLLEIESLESHLEEYVAEPIIYSCRRIDIELFDITNKLHWGTCRLDDIRDNGVTYEEYVGNQIEKLREYARLVSDHERQKRYFNRAERYVGILELIVAESKVPQEMKQTERRLEELLSLVLDGQKIDQDELSSITSRVEQYRSKPRSQEDDVVFEKIHQLLDRIHIVLNSHLTDEEKISLEYAMRNPGWQWRVLGISSGSPEKTVREAYGKLAKRFHSDVSGSDTDELMMIINYAHDVIAGKAD